MGTFLTAYTLVWLTFALYVGHLRLQHERLERTVIALQARLQAGPEWTHSTDKSGPGVQP